jgi:pimeloyl-ACP methyl ester carboxylesterase
MREQGALPPLAAWHAAGRYFDWRGHAIFARVDGDPARDALLLIHGFPTASWDWGALWAPLAARWRVLTLDLLGFGFSAKPRGHPYSIAGQADLLEDFLRAQGLARYHVLAHDYGDTVAQELLARQDQAGARPRLASAAFLNGGLFPEAHRPLPLQRLLASPLGPLLARAITRERFGASMIRIFGPDTPPSRVELDGFWSLIEQQDGRGVMPKLIGYMAERREHRARWVGALQAATVPMRLIDGAADPISGAHLAHRYRELVPQPDVVELPGIGHYPQLEAPQAVLEAYLAFRARSEREATGALQRP